MSRDQEDFYVGYVDEAPPALGQWLRRLSAVALAGAAGLLLMVATLASWLPARWAGRTNPVEALQAD